jgi:hypothetical protein
VYEIHLPDPCKSGWIYSTIHAHGEHLSKLCDEQSCADGNIFSVCAHMWISLIESGLVKIYIFMDRRK